MLIHQTDFLTVNLLRNYWRWVAPHQTGVCTVEWELCWLVFTVQVNGKLKTSPISFAVEEKDETTTFVPVPITSTSWGTGNFATTPKTYVVNNWTTITTAIDLLHDLWYEISINDVEDKINKIINNN